MSGDAVRTHDGRYAMFHPACSQQDHLVAARAARSSGVLHWLWVAAGAAVVFMFCCANTLGLSVLAKSGVWAVVGGVWMWFFIQLVYAPRHNIESLLGTKLVWLTNEVAQTYEKLMPGLAPRLPDEKRHDVSVELFRLFREAQRQQSWMRHGEDAGYTDTERYAQFKSERDRILTLIEGLVAGYRA